MKLLGAIIAGGQSTRFGSDKAEAIFQGRPLLDHVSAAIRPHVDLIIVVGRSWPDLPSIVDRPGPSLGPLAGVSAALHFALEQGYEAVLTASCDVLGLTADMIERLMPGPAIIATHPVIGLWPSTLSEKLDQWLAEEQSRSLYGFADHIGARRVEAGVGLINVNRPADLDRGAAV
jgi:molybdenum cofactor guanylyltransferase